MNRTSLRALGLCAAAVLLLPACGGGDDTADTGTTVGGAPVESAPAESPASDGTATDGTSSDGATGGSGTGDAATDPGAEATNPPVGSGGQIGGGRTGKTGPISGAKVCNRMKELLPTLKQAPSPQMARAQLAMGLGSLYAEAQQLQSLSNVDLDKITEAGCPKTRTQVLTLLKQKELGKL